MALGQLSGDVGDIQKSPKIQVRFSATILASRLGPRAWAELIVASEVACNLGLLLQRIVRELLNNFLKVILAFRQDAWGNFQRIGEATKYDHVASLNVTKHNRNLRVVQWSTEIDELKHLEETGL